MRTNEENLDLFADLLEPVTEILTDKEVVDGVKNDGNKIKAVKAAIKNHKAAVVQFLALLEGVDAEDYVVPPPAQFMMKILALVNKPEVQELFTLQGQTTIAASSGSATENIAEDEQDGVV